MKLHQPIYARNYYPCGSPTAWEQGLSESDEEFEERLEDQNSLLDYLND